MLTREVLAGVAEALDLDAVTLNDIRTAVTEACNNVVLHAYEGGEGPLEIELYEAAGEIEVVVRDHGAGIRPQIAPAEEGAAGLGLPVIQALAERVTFKSSSGPLEDPDTGTEVRMTFAARVSPVLGTPRGRDGASRVKPPAQARARGHDDDHDRARPPGAYGPSAPAEHARGARSLLGRARRRRAADRRCASRPGVRVTGRRWAERRGDGCSARPAPAGVAAAGGGCARVRRGRVRRAVRAAHRETGRRAGGRHGRLRRDASAADDRSSLARDKPARRTAQREEGSAKARR